MPSFAARAAVVLGLTAAGAVWGHASGTAAIAPPPGWVIARAADTTVVSNAGAAVATRVSQQLDETRALVHAALGDRVKTPHDPIVVLAVADGRSLRELLPQFWERRFMARPPAASSPAPHTHDIALRVDVSEGMLQEILLHEYLHVVTRVTVPDAPAWLDEGLSEFWGTLRMRDGALEVGRPPGRHLRALQGRNWIPLTELVKVPRGGYDAQRGKEALLYAQSWALVHYLLLKPSSGEAVTPGYAPALPADLIALERDLKEYVRAGPKPSAVAKTSARQASPKPQAPTVRALAESEALALRANFVVYGARPSAAPPLAQRALQIDPAEPLALEVMGVYYFLSNEHDTARTWFHRAVQAPGASYRAHYYYAILMDADAATAERHLRRALELRPGFEPALDRLHRAKPEAMFSLNFRLVNFFFPLIFNLCHSPGHA